MRTLENKITLKEGLEMMYLRDKGVHTITAEFSGGGDDGAIDDIQLYTSEDCDFKATAGNVKADLPGLEGMIIEMIDRNVYTIGDWVNNDGGWGNILINLETMKYTLDYNQRTSENHTWSDVNLDE